MNEKTKIVIKTQMIEIHRLVLNEGQIEGVPRNPRFIEAKEFDELVQSVKDHPKMLYLRELIVYDNKTELVVIGGNMRLRVCRELGYKEIPCKVLPHDTDKKDLEAYAIKDNISKGKWDFELLANDGWERDELVAWGMDEVGWIGDENIEYYDENHNSEKEGREITQKCPKCGYEF